MKHYCYEVRPNKPCPDCGSANVITLDWFYEYAECPDCGATSDPDESPFLYEGQKEDS